ncbi:MAG: DUF4440 domain-containing protein [Bacteroidetes bacterium]|nr:MAG: DUF4440 domain-containing protein [Bacteroidota bacterium]MBL1144394.1 DUF4440 domain-containing protein [Bacteroidota bacterium]NOG57190.1 DUF4440 domain-containing protein [Bacteroidota bacterium]
MNKLIVIASLMLFPFFGLTQSRDFLATEQIKLAMSMQEQQWNMGNIPGFMASYWKSDSLLFVGKSGPNYGWTKTLTNYLKSYPDTQAMGKLTFNNIKIEVLSNESAFVVGEWHLKREIDDLGGYYTLLWKKIDGMWKIVADHSSSK